MKTNTTAHPFSRTASITKKQVRAYYEYRGDGWSLDDTIQGMIRNRKISKHDALGFRHLIVDGVLLHPWRTDTVWLPDLKSTIGKTVESVETLPIYAKEYRDKLIHKPRKGYTYVGDVRVVTRFTDGTAICLISGSDRNRNCDYYDFVSVDVAPHDWDDDFTTTNHTNPTTF